MTIGKPTFLSRMIFDCVHFRGELQHVGHVGRQNIKSRPIRTGEIGGARLQDD